MENPYVLRRFGAVVKRSSMGRFYHTNFTTKVCKIYQKIHCNCRIDLLFCLLESKLSSMSTICVVYWSLYGIPCQQQIWIIIKWCYSLDISDLPVELLHRILVEAAIPSMRHTNRDDDVIEAVPTSQGDVCGLWREIINDEAGYFITRGDTPGRNSSALVWDAVYSLWWSIGLYNYYANVLAGIF